MGYIHYIQVAEPESGKTNLATKIVKQLELASLGPDDLYMEVSLIQPNWLRLELTSQGQMISTWRCRSFSPTGSG
jgi:hypothetical protein